MAAAKSANPLAQEPASSDGQATADGLRTLEHRLQQRMQEIVHHIESAKTQIAAVQPDQASSDDIRTVTGQLDAVGREAEQAATAFLDAAEQLGTLASELPDKASSEVQKIATQIFEASTFHDLTGQRISKAMQMLRDVEGQLAALSDVLDKDSLASPSDAPATSQNVTPDTAEPPLDGPDPHQKANRQDDIDALFSSLD